MTEERDRIYVRHIRDACEKITAYTQGMDLDEFLSRSMAQDAVIRQLEIVGEAAKQVSRQFRDENPNVRWADMAGMRDRLIHGYFGVDLETVWTTVERDIPTLFDALQSILAE